MFTHLHSHSFYSFSSGTIPADELPSLAASKGMTAIALTDTNNMTGAIEFYNAAKKAGIKPILGVEIENGNERAVLLAKNTGGYKEISETVTKVLEAIPKTKQKITYESFVNSKIEERQNNSESKSIIPFLYGLTDSVFTLSSSPEILTSLAEKKHPNLYMEIIPSEGKMKAALRDIYRRHNLPVVASNNVVLGRKSDHYIHKLLRAIGLNTNTGLVADGMMCSPSQYLTTEEELRKLLPSVSNEAFVNTQRIADACNVEFDFEKIKFTRFPCKDPKALLKSLAQQGFFWRYPNPSVEHIQRFSYELEMIYQLNATSYFLATHDMIEYAKRKDYPYLARGSGANSMIAYCLDISNVDPIENNLRFERFLNPERLMPPDFDVDFSWKDRYEVINYMLDKYGRDKSAMLCTIQTYKDRGSIREIGKALGLPESEINTFYFRLNELHHTKPHSELSSKKLDAKNKNLSDVSEWLLAANRIMGFPKHLSVHAGGVIFADKEMSNYCPTQMAPIGVPIMQHDMFTADDWKLIKLDVLATRGLGTYWDTMKVVRDRTGKLPPVTDVTVALNDKKTIDLVKEGKTKGCFYIESPAMISLLQKLRVDTFKLLTAASSIIRPGVASSGMMQEYIARHHDRKRISYAHPKMEELLSETYGIMIYQEDVLNVVHGIAGLSYGQADLFRRAMSGKLRSKESIEGHKRAFIDGCIKNGLAKELALELWRQISSFSGYSFCKAHSASYAVLSYQEAWLKVHYPTEFLCSVLNNYGGFYRHQEYINEAKALAIEVLLPDVNRSTPDHRVEQDHVIRLGLTGLKEVSDTSKQALLKNREESGYYTSIEDFALRSGVTPEDARILIAIGACDRFAKTREEMQILFASYSNSRTKSVSRKVKRKQIHGSAQESFALDTNTIQFDLSHLTESTPFQDFRLEKRYLGYSVTDHPCSFLGSDEGIVQSSSLHKFVNQKVTIQGYVASRKDIRTKKGEPMCLLNLTDADGMLDVVVWSDLYTRIFSVLAGSEGLRVTGTVQVSYEVYSIIASKVERASYG